MSRILENIEPKAVWKNFEMLNQVPRPSKKEELVIKFMVNFAKQHNLEVLVDSIQNVLIKKPATAGMENKKIVVLQAHLDMVHQKNNNIVFDFEKQGIEMYVEGDWVKANGTTLGADNGLGVAAIMAILESTTIAHPEIEALFTIDEETGMTGALELQPNFLTGELLLNLDTEDDDEVSIGCAGGIDVTATFDFEEVKPQNDSTTYAITVKGLQGGHSGMDIHKGLGNANKILARLLFDMFENFELQLASFKGGNLRNAIPRESKAIVTVPNKFLEAFLFEFNTLQKSITKEFEGIENELIISIDKTSRVEKVMEINFQKAFVRCLNSIDNGVFTMNSKIKSLVETSNNLARVIASDGVMEIACLTRSFSESGKMNQVNSLRSVFELASFSVTTSGDYPGWEPNPNTEIVDLLKNTYIELFEETPKVMACHAGLECGILGTHYPNLQMVSFGPNIRGAHSPDEKASIQSTQKFWKLLKEVLRRIPEKTTN